MIVSSEHCCNSLNSTASNFLSPFSPHFLLLSTSPAIPRSLLPVNFLMYRLCRKTLRSLMMKALNFHRQYFMWCLQERFCFLLCVDLSCNLIRYWHCSVLRKWGCWVRRKSIRFIFLRGCAWMQWIVDGFWGHWGSLRVPFGIGWRD